MRGIKAGAQKELSQVLVGLVPWLVFALLIFEVLGVTKILAHDEQQWPGMAEPLRPVADYVRVEFERCAGSDFAWIAIDAKSASLSGCDKAGRNEILKLHWIEHLARTPTLLQPRSDGHFFQEPGQHRRAVGQ